MLSQPVSAAAQSDRRLAGFDFASVEQMPGSRPHGFDYSREGSIT